MLSNEKIEMFLRHKSIPSKGTTIKILQELLMLREVKKCADDMAYQIQKYEDVYGFERKAPLASLKEYSEIASRYK